MTKASQCEKHSNEAVKIPSHSQRSVIRHCSGLSPCEHAQSERDNVENENNEVEHIPAITER